MKRKRIRTRGGSWDDMDKRNHRCTYNDIQNPRYHYKDGLVYRFESMLDPIGFRIVSPSFFVINKEMVEK